MTDGEHVRFGRALGTRRMLSASATGGTFGLVEHDLPAGQFGSPVHTHEREDEYSYVLSGRLTAQVGDDVIEAGPGELVVKPRSIPHAFWNAGTEPLRFLELVSPGGFEEYFFELAAPFNARDRQAMEEIRARYRLDVRMETIPELLERNGLQPPFYSRTGATPSTPTTRQPVPLVTIALRNVATAAIVSCMTTEPDHVDDLLPLPPATFHILLALVDEERHGYAIIQDVEARTDGDLRMSAGTLYRSIARMVEQGLISEVAKRRTAADDERRRYYRLTSFGTAVARAEMRRLSQLVRLARARGLTPETA